jgi:hypothetical protein
MIFANRYSPVELRRVGALNRYEKCSWVVKATQDAPVFRIYTAAESLIYSNEWGYDLHYVEYDDTKVRQPQAPLWLDYSDTATNQVKGTFYDKNFNQNNHWPPVYQVANPTATSSFKKRWFMSRLVDQQVSQEVTAIYRGYQTLKVSYDTKLDAYNKAVNPMLAFGYNYNTVSNWL